MSEVETTGRFAPLHATIATAPASAEDEVLAQWRADKTFDAVERARGGAESFVFWEGPPTANGRPGIHHVLARTIKDAVCRYQTMRGKRVVRKAGWDTHGLPVELEVEKRLGISGKPEIEKFGVARFNEECKKSVWTYRKEWEELSERIGYWLDYAHPYVTYEDTYIESIWYILKRFHQAGLLYQGKRVVPYCGRCGTGLSSHELGQPGVYRDVSDPSVFVRFVLLPDDHTGEGTVELESLVAWTTTPWTLPSNSALAVNPGRTYLRLRLPLPTKGDSIGNSGSYESVWVVKERAVEFLQQCGYRLEAQVLRDRQDIDSKQLSQSQLVVETKSGLELVGRRYEPLYKPAVPRITPRYFGADDDNDIIKPPYLVVDADFVSVEDGTGIVHIAPAYGADDWEVARRKNLVGFEAVGGEGRFAVDVASVKAGTFFKDADDKLMEDLKSRGLLFGNKHRAVHSYPHCWRCDTPLFYYAIPAWYIRTTQYCDRMIEQNGKVNWVPAEVGAGRFGEWLKNNIDWNISRERYWGTPLPFWQCTNRNCSAIEVFESLQELKERFNSWRPGPESFPADFEFHRPGVDKPVLFCRQCNRGMLRTKSVLDAWFDSGAMPYAQYGWPHVAGSDKKLRDQFPADFIAEGLDQTRGWFYTLHAIGAFVTSLPDVGLPQGPTYRTCVVNGLLLDKDGVKMSKRLGNVVDPRQAIAEHGADALRWYLLASGSPWLPKRFDPNGLLEVRRRFLGTLVNSYRFLAEYARLDGFDPSDAAIPMVAARPEIDRWLVSRTHTVTSDVIARMEEFDLAGACRAIETFVVDEVSNWYIRRNRRRFWKSETAGDKLAAFATLHAALVRMALLLAPSTPFLAEMLWRRLSEEEGSVHAQVLAEADAAEIDADLEASMRVVARIVEMGRALRERARLRVRQPLRAIHVRSSDERNLALLRTPFAAEQILDELNIRAFGSLGADDGQLCSLRAKPNFRALGKRLGGRMKAAAAAIEALPGTEIARLRRGEEIALEIDGERLAIVVDDIQVSVETHAEFDVETDGRHVVWLDTVLDDDLIAEGLAREVVNRVNALRKDAGLAVDDRIRLRLEAGGDRLLGRAIEVHGDAIARDVLAVEVSKGAEGFAGGATGRFDLDEGRSLAVALARA